MPWIIAVTIEQGAIFIILLHVHSVYSKCKLREHNNNFLNHTPFHPLHYTFTCRGERGEERGGRERKRRGRGGERGKEKGKNSSDSVD